MVVEAPATAVKVGEGSSVAVSGVCLTVTEINGGQMTFSILPETLRVTNIGSWAAGQKVDLEPSLKLGDELSGHLVYGHVDGIAEIVGIVAEGASTRMTIKMPKNLMADTVMKGSVSVDGVSLTIAGLTEDTFDVALVEYTLDHTTLGGNKVGDKVHIETDMILKYLHRLYLTNYEGSSA